MLSHKVSNRLVGQWIFSYLHIARNWVCINQKVLLLPDVYSRWHDQLKMEHTSYLGHRQECPVARRWDNRIHLEIILNNKT